jgi:hypothetical protein
MNRNVTIAAAVVLVVIICIFAYTKVWEIQSRSARDDAWRKLGETDAASQDAAWKIYNDDLDRALPMLFKALRDDNATRRQNAIAMLARFVPDLRDKKQNAEDAIMETLGDGDPAVRIAACQALAAKFHCAGCIEKLESLADADPDIVVRQAAIFGLGYVAGENEVVFLANKIRNSRDDSEGRAVKRAASAALGLTGRADALFTLLARLQDKDGLMVETEQLHAVAALAGDLRDLQGSDNKQKAIAALDAYPAQKGLDALIIEQHDDESAGAASSPRSFYAALLRAFHDWGAGDRVGAYIEKIKSSSGEERALYENVVHDYILSLMSAGEVASGADISVVVDISDADKALLLDICGQLIDLIGSESGQFAQDNLNLITRLNLGGDVVKWREQYDKWKSGGEKFNVEPLPEKTQ